MPVRETIVKAQAGLVWSGLSVSRVLQLDKAAVDGAFGLEAAASLLDPVAQELVKRD